jgi:hypothetical protein
VKRGRLGIFTGPGKINVRNLAEFRGFFDMFGYESAGLYRWDWVKQTFLLTLGCCHLRFHPFAAGFDDRE